MTGEPLDYRLRFWLFTLISVLGFTAPWNWAMHLDGRGPNAHTWGLLAVELAKTGRIGIDTAFNLVLAAATLSALAGAWLRTWGSASIGADVMLDQRLRGEAVMADGPYCFLRNPLYLGTMLNTLALAVLMPASGAALTLVLAGLLIARLIQVEERFLREKLGAAYLEYARRVPRLVPVLNRRPGPSGRRPRWLAGALAEVFPWGVAASFAALGWKYNAGLLVQCVLVSLGVSLVVRAFAVGRTAG